MIRKPTIAVRFDVDELERVIAALRSSKGDNPASKDDIVLARHLQRIMEIDLDAHRAAEEARKAEEARRLARAENHVLTKRQAEALAAVRAGHGPHDKPYYWTDPAGNRQWRWTFSRSMGGAVYRMADALVEEGLLTDRWKLTEPGLKRLEAYEAKHGRVGP